MFLDLWRINIKTWQSSFLSFLIFFAFCSEADSPGKHGANVSLDVLPVKGPQSSPLLSQAVHPPQDKLLSEEIWTVQPAHLILVAPSTCEYVSNDTTGIHSETQSYTYSLRIAYLEYILGLDANVTSGFHRSSSYLLET